jgi:hypothetical protein
LRFGLKYHRRHTAVLADRDLKWLLTFMFPLALCESLRIPCLIACGRIVDDGFSFYVALGVF